MLIGGKERKKKNIKKRFINFRATFSCVTAQTTKQWTIKYIKYISVNSIHVLFIAGSTNSLFRGWEWGGLKRKKNITKAINRS